MNQAHFFVGCLRVLWRGALLVTLSVLGVLADSPAQPNITRVEIDGTNFVVHVEVPAGLRKMTLLSRSRMVGSAWIPRAVQRVEADGGSLTFKLPLGPEMEVLSVQGEYSEPVPASFFSGTNHFITQVGGNLNGPDKGMTDALGTPGTPVANTQPMTRTVVESDIYRLKGDTLYLYNQMRGLQVVDLTDAASPRLTGTYSRPASGEQMYLLESGEVVLLCRRDCESLPSAEIVVLSVAAGVPNVAASVVVPGWIQDSRLVGNVLYVVSARYEQQETAQGVMTWSYFNSVTSIDLGAPGAPVVRDSLRFDSWNPAIMATDRYLFVAEMIAYGRDTKLNVIDISAPDGVMARKSVINIPGTIPDKFKMDLNGDVFTCIALKYDDKSGLVTVLSTYSLSDPTQPKALGSLELGGREQLHASRFDGNKVYIVTFRQIDPLWVVDLSDPSNPAIKGEIQVPGWSTYLQPMGDRLLSVGIDVTNGWHATVSLFDVGNPAKPLLADRVKLGGNWSWSEALTDEKAFKVLPDSGLILIPTQYTDDKGQWTSGMQLIDFSRSNLVLRGVIPQSFSARRADVHGEEILSISATSLLTVDATDRDHPVVKNSLPLAWGVSAVEPYGAHLVQISERSPDGGAPQLLVTTTNDTGIALSRQSMPTNWGVWGTSRRGDHLYVLQGTTVFDYTAYPNPEDVVKGTNRTQVMLSVWDLSKLPAVTFLGQTLAGADVSGVQADFKPFWTAPHTIVWASTRSQSWGGPIFQADVMPIIGQGLWYPWWYGSSLPTFFTFDVKDDAAPAPLSAITVGSSGWSSTTTPFQSGKLLYFSHTTNFFGDWRFFGWAAPQTGTDPAGEWVRTDYLDVIDFSDPTLPTLRPSVSLPGELVGISHGGAMLYTISPDPALATKYNYAYFITSSSYLTAAAYDGVAAFKVDGMSLGDYSGQPAQIVGDRLCLAFYKTNYQGGFVETWKVNDSGRFERLASTEFGTAPTLTRVGDYLGIQMARTLSVASIGSTGLLKIIATANPEGCIYPQGDAIKGDPSTGFWISLGTYGPLPLKNP